ncbi:MAG: hypothetical protein KC996_07215 [Phycisphaerales bacterium]|nr:hypothetical protein [Phycisphaerales bacterium]
MTQRVCYLQRADRGGRVAGVSLVGAHTRDTWEAGALGDTEVALGTIRDAAAWIKERLLAGSEKTRRIGTLCLDTDGAVCSWVKPEDADPDLLRASVEQAGEIDHDDFDAPEATGASERFPDLPLEVAYEPLRESPTSVGARTAVIATPDIPARLLIDQLDAIGIRIDSITTLWHAVALAWDPGARASGLKDSQRIVASSSPVTACVVADSDKGLLVWSWSQAGTLIACGSVRLAKIGGTDHQHAIVTEPGIARLGADWLGWSSQLGVAPSRIIFVAPGFAQSPPQEDSPALDGAGIGNALARAWPGASIDLVEHDDPIGETLAQLARREVGTSLTALGARPGRAHRSMYRWGAASLIAASVVVGIGAWHFFGRASESKNRIAAVAVEQRSLLDALDPTIALSPFPLSEVQTKIAELRGSADPLIPAEDRPIMTELDTISLVIGVPGISIQSIVVNSFGATVIVRSDEIQIAEQLGESLDQIGGSSLEWRTPNFVRKGDQYEATFKATWSGLGGTP